jgi:sugar (pentulose or hexulose) kinase
MHLARAVLEGVAFSLRAGRETLSELGMAVHRPYFTGGGSDSRLWTKIAAAVLGVDGAVVAPQGPALGASMLAARAIDAPRAPRRRERAVVPPVEWVDAYAHVYAVYRDAVERLTLPSHALAAIGRP